MGVALYLEPIFSQRSEALWPQFYKAAQARDQAKEAGREEEVARWQDEVKMVYDTIYGEGVFRESCNDASVLYQMGTDWVILFPFCTKKQQLRPKKAAAFALLLTAFPLPAPEQLQLTPAMLEEDTAAGWHGYFTDKRRRLLELLTQAVERGLTIDCSW